MKMKIDYQAIHDNVDKYIERKGDLFNLGEANYAGTMADRWVPSLMQQRDTNKILLIGHYMWGLSYSIILHQKIEMDKRRLNEDKNAPDITYFKKAKINLNLKLLNLLDRRWNKKSQKHENPLGKLIGFMQFQESDDTMFNRKYLPYIKNCFAFEAYFDLIKLEESNNYNFEFDYDLRTELDRIPKEMRDPIENSMKNIDLEEKL